MHVLPDSWVFLQAQLQCAFCALAVYLGYGGYFSVTELRSFALFVHAAGSTLRLFPCWCRSGGKSVTFCFTVHVPFNTSRFFQSARPDAG